MLRRVLAPLLGLSLLMAAPGLMDTAIAQADARPPSPR